MNARPALSVALALLAGVFVGQHLGDWPHRASPQSGQAGASRPAPADGGVWEHRVNARVQGRTAVPCPADALVVLVLGQSNAANSVGARHRSDGGSTNWFDGRCYLAVDPMLGSDGVAGSVWPLVGDQLVHDRAAAAVTFAAFTLDGTPSAAWADPDGIGALLKRRIAGYRQAGLPIRAVLWQQGESDIGTPVDTYLRNVEAVFDVVRAGYPDAAIFVSRSSLCEGLGPSRPELLAAQASLPGTLAGPDTDTLAQPQDRYDGCHFSDAGAQRLAALWVKALEDGLRPASGRATPASAPRAGA